ncbi:MAG: hypothetical protein ACRDZO_03500 [Egibacteraceae bacterium]
MLTIVVPPNSPLIDPASAGSYPAPVLLDGHECASFTPCHLAPIIRPISDFAALGQLTLRCPATRCVRWWKVRWHPGHTYALWIE